MFHDAHGFRPMWTGNVDGDVAIASESCAMDILRATETLEIAPGEIMIITQTNEYSTTAFERLPLLDDGKRQTPPLCF